MNRCVLLNCVVMFLAGTLVVVQGQLPDATQPILEEGKIYRLPKDAALVPRHPRDFDAKDHEIDLGTLTNSRTIQQGTSVAVRRVRAERAGNWYFVDIPDPGSFSPPMKDTTGWISEADFGGTTPSEVVEISTISGKNGPILPETRYLLIFHGAAMGVMQERMAADPSRADQFTAWMDEAKMKREALMDSTGMERAAVEAMLRTTTVEDYARWIAEGQLNTRVPAPPTDMSPVIADGMIVHEDQPLMTVRSDYATTPTLSLN